MYCVLVYTLAVNQPNISEYPLNWKSSVLDIHIQKRTNVMSQNIFIFFEIIGSSLITPHAGTRFVALKVSSRTDSSVEKGVCDLLILLWALKVIQSHSAPGLTSQAKDREILR